MSSFLMPLMFIFLAEMGDKSMLLALAFATKYDWKLVLAGVFSATILNHLMVVLLGSYITSFASLQTITIVCALAFIGFGIWTIRGDELTDGDMNKTKNKTPFWTVAIAFFISEMGDKTQLATLTLATQYDGIISVWLGTTFGMVLADAVGIILGKVLGKRIPEDAIKWVSALVFIGFGFAGLYENIPVAVTMPKASLLAGIFFITLVLIYALRRKDSGEVVLEIEK